MSGGVNMTIVSISKPVNRDIKTMDSIIPGNFLSFQIKIRLPMTPLITVEMAHGRAVAPLRVYLYAPDIIPTGIPKTGPPNRPLIITTMHLMLAGRPSTSMWAYDAKSPTAMNMARQVNTFFRLNFPSKAL